ncbi:MAG: hypothetical protein K6F86_05040 [Lachnospiraceae bacterium]|nr:hypothetical protein [Lachnospiraceae bacterium]
MSDNLSCSSRVVSTVEIPHGIRIQTDNTLTLDIASFSKGDVVFNLTRLLGYEGEDRGFDLNSAPEETFYEAGADEITLNAGAFTVRAGKTVPEIRIEREGRLLTSIKPGDLGFERNPAGEADEYPVSMTVGLSFGASEIIWGFGGTKAPFVKNGQTIKGTFPIYFSDKGYALLCDHKESVSFSVGGEDPGRMVIRVPGEQLSFHLISGKDIREISANLKNLTGMPGLVPAADFSPWIFADPSIVCDSTYIGTLHGEGFRICMNAGPFVRQDDILFAEGLEKGYFTKREDGRGIKQEDRLPGAPALIDVEDPSAVKWYSEKVKELLDNGVDGLSSYYPELLTDLLPDASVSLFSGNPDPDSSFVVYRIPDADKNFSHMARTLRSGLSMTFGGAAYFCHEISPDMADRDPELFKRWIQFGCFSTHFGLRLPETRQNGVFFEGEELEVFKKFSGIKNMLMPYLYEQACISHETGLPVARPMAMAFPEDPACFYLDRQYMLGESILVAPVFEEKGKSRFYLPSGKWKNLLDDEILAGPGFYDRTYDTMHMAVFVRENTLLPVGGENDRPDYDYTKGLTLHYFLPEMGKGVVTQIPDTSGNRVMTFKAFFGGGRAEVRMLEPSGMGKVPVTVHMPDGTEESGYTL